MGNTISQIPYEQLLDKIREYEKLDEQINMNRNHIRLRFDRKEKVLQMRERLKDQKLLKKSIVKSIKQFRDEMKADYNEFQTLRGKTPARVLKRNKYKLLSEHQSTIYKKFGLKYVVPSFSSFASRSRNKSKKTKS